MSIKTESGPALARPTSVDPRWAEKVEMAKQIRLSAQESRKHKPSVFPMNWSLQPGTI